MNGRKQILRALLCVAVLAVAMIPPTRTLDKLQDVQEAHDAEHVVRPMLEMIANSPASRADAPVEPMMDIENLWEIEDTRAEAEDALVVGMRCGADTLGYDSESRTFYCTVGMENGEMWPQLELFAQAADGAENLRVVWVDDYSYDYPADALAEGYRYELMAYTDTEYAYIGMVFTGLPVVTLRVNGGYEALGETYMPAYITASGADCEAVSSGAQVHLRGGGFPQQYPKLSFRVELCGISDKGRLKKSAQSVLGMPKDTDWLLIGNVADPSRVRNHMAWQLWKEWNADGRAFSLLESRLAEVFVDDTYMGLYQLMQRVDAEREIERMGGRMDTDVCMRIITEMNIEHRPYVNKLEDCGYIAELRCKPTYMSSARAMEMFEPYYLLNAKEKKQGYADDAAFEQAILAHTDIRELLEYFVFAQAVSFGYDNTFNNVYLWALRGDDGYVYHCSPWDMDCAFRPVYTDSDENINLWYPQIVRMLDLNVGGAREILWEIWQGKKAQLLTEDALYQRFLDIEKFINDSGAYRRDMMKWEDQDIELSLAEYSVYTIEHQRVIERYFSELWPLEDEAARK